MLTSLTGTRTAKQNSEISSSAVLVWDRFSITDAKVWTESRGALSKKNPWLIRPSRFHPEMLPTYLEEGESPCVAREPQAQHALQLWDGNMEGSGAGESLDNWLWQIGGEEAQLETKHTELGHKRLTRAVFIKRLVCHQKLYFFFIHLV